MLGAECTQVTQSWSYYYQSWDFDNYITEDCKTLVINTNTNSKFMTATLKIGIYDIARNTIVATKDVLYTWCGSELTIDTSGVNPYFSFTKTLLGSNGYSLVQVDPSHIFLEKNNCPVTSYELTTHGELENINQPSGCPEGGDLSQACLQILFPTDHAKISGAVNDQFNFVIIVTSVGNSVGYIRGVIQVLCSAAVQIIHPVSQLLIYAIAQKPGS